MVPPVSPELHQVSIFRAYPFRVGEKIFLASGPRGGDWEVVGVSDRKVKLRCPISNREVEWDRFYFFVEQRQAEPWPHAD